MRVLECHCYPTTRSSCSHRYCSGIAGVLSPRDVARPLVGATRLGEEEVVIGTILARCYVAKVSTNAALNRVVQRLQFVFF